MTQRIEKMMRKLNIKNGEVIIRSNYNSELLIWIKSKDKIKPNIPYLKQNYKIVGIILNHKLYIYRLSRSLKIVLFFLSDV